MVARSHKLLKKNNAFKIYVFFKSGLLILHLLGITKIHYNIIISEVK